jgi:hypothetical protein
MWESALEGEVTYERDIREVGPRDLIPCPHILGGCCIMQLFASFHVTSIVRNLDVRAPRRCKVQTEPS